MSGITIRGLKEVSAKLRRVEPALGRKIIRRAFRQALKPVKARVRDLAPVKTGQTKAAVKVLAGRSRRGRITMRVVIGKGAYKGDQYYAAYQEYGFRLGSRKRGGSRPQIEGKHFMKRAFDETADKARDDAERLILEGVMAELKG